MYSVQYVPTYLKCIHPYVVVSAVRCHLRVHPGMKTRGWNARALFRPRVFFLLLARLRLLSFAVGREQRRGEGRGEEGGEDKEGCLNVRLNAMVPRKPKRSTHEVKRMRRSANSPHNQSISRGKFSYNQGEKGPFFDLIYLPPS